MPGDQVSIAGDISRGPATRNDDVALAAQVEEGSIFASPSQSEMGRFAGCYNTIGDLIELSDGVFEQMDAGLGNASHVPQF